MILFTTEQSGTAFSARANGATPFAVGKQVLYKQNVGLANDGASLPPTLLYAAVDFATRGFWAAFIEPTAWCEGRSFLTINTYDRAAFTFGFSQFGAHVPDGDFIHYFHTLLALPEAKDYFPDLELQAGRIVHLTPHGTAVPLESATSTQPLMDYLNPTLVHVEPAEVLAAARLIHWTTHQSGAREAQVAETIRTFGVYMADADRHGLIDGRIADQCCVIADILHQGRGRWSDTAIAIRGPHPYAALLAIGGPEWASRRTTLDQHIRRNPLFATMRWSSARQDFIGSSPAAAPGGTGAAHLITADR